MRLEVQLGGSKSAKEDPVSCLANIASRESIKRTSKRENGEKRSKKREATKEEECEQAFEIRRPPLAVVSVLGIDQSGSLPGLNPPG